MRLKVVALSGLSSLAAKFITVFFSFVTVPLVLDHLGSDRFGVWMIIASLPGFISFFDFGIGNCVLNAIAKENGQENPIGVRRALSNGIAMLFILGLTFSVLFVFIFPFVNWSQLLGLKESSPSLITEANRSVLALGLIFLLSLPASLVQRLFLGLQKGFLKGVWDAIAGIVSFAAILITIHYGGGAPSLVFAMFGVASSISIISAIHLFMSRPELIPLTKDIDKTVIKKFIKEASYFFILSLSVTIAFASDQLIVSHNLNLNQVGVFSIYQKLFSPVPMLLAFVLMPLWAAYADALSMNDIAWIKSILKKSIKTVFISVVIIITITVYFSTPILDFWVGKRIEPNIELAIFMGVWVIIDAVGKCVAIFLNGVGLIKEQLIIVVIFAPLCIILKIFFTDRIGLVGLPIAASVAYIMTHLTGYFFILKKWFLKNKTNN